jgi:tetratricopeptide (TPR) repeat protein
MRVTGFLIPAVLLLVPCAAAQQLSQPRLDMPGETPAEVQAQKRLNDGQRLMSEDAFEEAAKAFQEAIALEPLLMMAHYGLGTARMGQKDYAAAVTAFEAARQAFQERAARNAARQFKSATAREARVRVLREAIRNVPEPSGAGGGGGAAARQEGIQRREWEAELAALEATQESGPPKPPPGLLLALGSAYFRSGRLPDAEREYRAASDAQPKLGEPRINLAVVLLVTGRPAEAKEQLKLAEKGGFKPPAGLKADVEAALTKLTPR